MSRSLIIILSGFFIVMTGFGITLPIIPFYLERILTSEGIALVNLPLHVSLISGGFFLMQFIFSPYLGSLSDKVGRRPLILTGLLGYSVSMFLFSAGNILIISYLSGFLNGIFSAVLITSTSAYIADKTHINNRARGMSLLAGVTSLGAVVGGIIVILFSRVNMSIVFETKNFMFDNLSLPFLIISILTFIVFIAMLFLLPESINALKNKKQEPKVTLMEFFKFEMKPLRKIFIILLALSFISQFSLSMFEGTFGLHSQKLIDFGPEQMSIVFIVCGGTMAILQFGPVGWLIGKTGEYALLPYSFLLMSIGTALLMTTKNMTMILIYVSFISIGSAIIIPSISSLITKCSEKRHGAALGIFGSLNSLAQAAGVITSGSFLIWYIHLPYWITSAILFIAVFFILSNNRIKKYHLSNYQLT